MFSIDELVGGVNWEMTQPFGRTYFSTHEGAPLYRYGESYCLPWGTHPGIDVGIPARTALYSPVRGRVILAGATSVFTNVLGGSNPQTGQLKIEMEDGSHVILGHMRRIDVEVDQQVEQGQYVGLSGHANGDHVHVEIRRPGGGCVAPFHIVNPVGSILIEHGELPVEPQAANLRLFRVQDVDALSVRDYATTDSTRRGEYRRGEVIPCHKVILAQEVETGEMAWGQTSGGAFSGKWVYLGFTTEVQPGDDGVEFYSVTTSVKNIRITPDSTRPPVAAYVRGDILPIGEVVDGEVVDEGQAQWGKFAHGPYEGLFAYLGSNSTLKLS